MTTSITTRAGKGSPLTHDEVDANFTNLQTTADAALPLAGGTLTGPVTMTGGTVTTSTPLIDATQTWNASGVTFTGLKLNITNTASASGSKFAEFQISGTPIVWMEKSGAVVVTSPSDTNKAFRLDSAPGGGLRLEYAGNLEARMSSSGVDLRSNGLVSWSSSAGQADSPGFTCIGRNADGVLEINNQTAGTYRDLMLRNLLAVGGTVTTSTPLIDATQTWNAAGVTFTGWSINITNTASAEGSLLADFQVGGVSKAQITVDGKFGAGKGYVYARPQFFDSNYGAGSGFQIKSDRELTLYTYDTAVMGVSDGSTGVRIHGSISLGFVDGHAIANNPDVRLWRDAAATLAQRDGTNAQTYRIYGTYTDSSNYVRASLSSSSTTVTLQSETAGTGADDVNLILRAAGSGNIVPQSTLRASGSGVEYQAVDGSNNTTGRFSSNFLECGSGHSIRWRDNVDARSGSSDSGLARNAAGVVEVNSGTAATYRDLKLRNLLAAGGNGSYVQTPSMTVANLAAAGTAGAGARAFVTDATATTFLSTVAGGGSNKVPVVSDGTNWLIG